MKQWNQKLSESCTRKSTRLDGISKTLKEKMSEKEKKFHSLRVRLDETTFSNPEYANEGSKSLKKKRRPVNEKRKNERIPTESFV